MQHKTALRKVANTHYNPCHLIPIADLCRPLKILPVHSLFKDFNSVYAYDILQKNTPDYINFIFQISNHIYVARNKFSLFPSINSLNNKVLHVLDNGKLLTFENSVQSSCVSKLIVLLDSWFLFFISYVQSWLLNDNVSMQTFRKFFLNFFICNWLIL